MQFFRRWLEPRVLAVVIAVTSTLWIFIEVAQDVASGHTGAVDMAILNALRAPGDPARPLGPAWFAAGIRDITALGSPAVLGLVVVITALFLLLAHRHWTALFVLLATSSGMWLSTVLKEAFDRPRPNLLPRAESVYSASFPSGHAMLSAIVYLTLGALLARLVPRRVMKLYVLGVALLLTGAIGFSRIYLGVHWPTDVLAGWAAGATWALVWWGAAELLRHRGGRP